MILNSSWLQLNGHFWNQASMGIEGRRGLRLATHGAGSRSQGATCKYEQRALVARAGIRGIELWWGVKIHTVFNFEWVLTSHLSSLKVILKPIVRTRGGHLACVFFHMLICVAVYAHICMKTHRKHRIVYAVMPLYQNNDFESVICTNCECSFILSDD